MATVQIWAGVFPAGAMVGLFEGRTVVQQAQVAADSTVAFDGLPPGGVYTVARLDGEGPTVNVTATPPGTAPAHQVHAKHQAEALKSGNQNPNPPSDFDPRTGRWISR